MKIISSLTVLLFASIYSVAIQTSYAATVEQITISDPILGKRQITYEAINGYAIVEGDILIGKIKTLRRPGAVVTPKVSGGRWPDGIVPYEISEDLPFINKLAIYQAIALWQEKSNVEFVELNTTNRYYYKDYISFVSAEGATCSSHVGRQGGAQPINLAPRCNTMNTTHEIGHALGLWHEQSRLDRNEHVRIVWENIDADHKHNFNQHLTESKDHGPYDYDSMMHYTSKAFSKNGEDTIVPLEEGVEIGQRNHVSEGDFAAVNAMYPQF